MPTGQASRASVLTSACLWASGASPRHSAIFCARSSKRTVRLISGVALDECLDPERYRARVPFLNPTFNTVEKIRSDPRFRKFLRWLYNQQEGAFFRTRRNRNRTSQPYR
jgi:hypothetical protein